MTNDKCRLFILAEPTAILLLALLVAHMETLYLSRNLVVCKAEKIYKPLTILTNDSIHFPVSEAGSGIHNGGPFVDAHPILDGDSRTYLTSPVFKVVRQAGV